MFSRRQLVTVRIRERNSSPDEVAGYFAEIARSLDARPRKLSLVFDSTVPIVFDIDSRSGEYLVKIGDEVKNFSLRHRWLPEHPLPLAIGPGNGDNPGIVRLKITPTTGNRFRVSDGSGVKRIPVWFAFTVMTAAAVAVLTLHPVAVALTAVATAIWITVAVINRRRNRPSRSARSSDVI